MVLLPSSYWMPSSNLLSVVISNDDETYGVINEVVYEVIQVNSGASLVTRNIE